jgi:hypothetical protein
MKMILIKENSSEWNYMWEWLEKHPANEGIENPSIAYNNGDAWAYMGSFSDGKRTIHEFRHKNHPKSNGGVVTTLVNASDKFSEADIEKEIKLK